MDPLASRPIHGGNLVWAASLANCSPSAILDFSASINPLGPPASAIAALQSHLGDLKAYPDPQYCELRSALGEFHHIPPEYILPGNGAAELLTWACRDLAALPATCVVTPAFSDYQRALKAFDATVLACPLDPLAHGQWDLARALSIAPTRHPAGKAIGLLLNNPHNPTGSLLLSDLLSAHLNHYAVVVVDEAFMDFLPPDEQQSVLDLVVEHPNLVVLRSLTKFYSLPGLRLGYAIAHPDRLKRWQEWRDPWSVNALAAAVGAVIVQDTTFQQQTWQWLATAKPLLFQGLSDLPGLQPDLGAANFLLVRSKRSVVQLQTELLKQHQVLIRDCVSFPALGDRYFRVAIRTEAENQRLLDGLSQILSNGKEG
ncbi:threonine-phosphate decarboxylase [Stenomitos frigidus ULC18]|uniref:threonine-phosphate decarboxylase n=1 Tax=Stenomitos frigidus ULC18 TaxID=2107698 RepID=A0A2T1E761_9CYAN|nr:threonine-phosphate decarboxylase [Stenomitos frigidus ULC18]